MIVITSEIIKMCTKKLKPGNDDGDMSFKSDYITWGSLIACCIVYVI